MKLLFTFMLGVSILIFDSGLMASDGSLIRDEDKGQGNALLDDEIERFSKTYKLRSNGIVEVGNINGSISIEAWDRDEVELVYEKRSRRRERLQDIEVTINATQDKISAETKFGKNKKRQSWNDNLRVNYYLKVPRNARLDEISSVNGAVTLVGNDNYAEISVVNGAVRATGIRGNVDLSSVNGSINAEIQRLNWDAKVSLETVNGAIALAIPSNSGATIEANTLNGGISNDFGLKVEKKRVVGKKLSGRIGNGAASVKASSVNGAIRIRTSGKTIVRNKKPRTAIIEGANDKHGNQNAKALSIAEATKSVEAAIETAKLEIERNSEVDLAKLKRNMIRTVWMALESVDKDSLGIDQSVFEKVIESIQNESVRALEAHARARFFRETPYFIETDDELSGQGIENIYVDAGKLDVSLLGWDDQKVAYSLLTVNQGSKFVGISASEENGDARIAVVDDKDNSNYVSQEASSLRIKVPRGAKIRVKTEGSIRLAEYSGEAVLESKKGEINVRDSEGKLGIESGGMNGRQLVRVIGYKGELEANLENSNAYLEGDFSKIDAIGNEGSVVLTVNPNTNATIMGEGITVKDSSLEFIEMQNGSLKLGSGVAKFNFDLGTGNVILRTKDSIKSKS